MTTKSTHPLSGALFALIGFALFSTHDAIIKSFAGGLGVFQIMFFSALFSMPWVMILLMTDGKEENYRPKRPVMLLLRTVFGMAAGGFAFFAFMKLPMADVYGLLFTTPFWITIMSIPFLGEKVGRFRWFAVVLGFIGVLVMLPLDLSSFTLGHLSAALAAFCGATNAIITRKIGKSEREAVMIMVPLIITLVLLTFLLPYNYYAPTSVQLYKLIAIGALSFIAQLCIIIAYKKSDAAIIAPMQYSQLIWAIIYGVSFFNDDLPPRKLIGAAIVIISGLIILYRELRGPNSISRPSSTFRNFRPDVIRSWVKPKEN